MKLKKKAVFGSTTAIASFFMALFLAEGLLRILGTPPLVMEYRNKVPDPVLPWKPRPFSISTGRSSTDEFDYEYVHNDFGFRDHNHTLNKPIGTFRILGLGDSFTYGVGAAFEETYLYRLEEILNSHSEGRPTIEIIKAGIPRFFPEPQRLLLDAYGRQYAPDLVLVAFLPNDIVDTFAGINAIGVDESGYLTSKKATKIGPVGKKLYLHTHLGRLLIKQFLAHQTPDNQQPRWPDVYLEGGFHEKDWKTVENEYLKIAAISKEIGAKVVILHIPQIGPWDERHAYPAKRLLEFTSKHNLHFLDALPYLQQAEVGEPLYYRKDGHCTPKGYEIIAQALKDHLQKHNLVP